VIRVKRLALASLALVMLAPASASAVVETEEAKGTSPAGEVVAQLSYDRQGDFEYEDVRIKITRGGQTLLDALVPAPCDECPTNPAGGGEADFPSLVLRDLDANGEPEALIDLYTGGAHCCSYTQIYGYDAATNGYRRTKGTWGDVGYTLKDLDRDGSPEFRSADWRFSSAFTAYVVSGFPLQIWKYSGGKLNDVTRGYKRLIKSNLKGYLKLYNRERKEREFDIRGFLSAYAADKYLLGQGGTAFDLVYAAHRRGELHGFPGDTSPSGKRYISALRKFLRRTGYR